MSTIAMIGSFRKHYQQIADCWQVFNNYGIEATSPPFGSEVLDSQELFVRLSSDPPDASNSLVQTKALHRILRADAVYVVSPEGYIGPTTAYEIGRIIQSRRPLYFSERPNDLPIFVPDKHVLSAEGLAKLIADKDLSLRPLYDDDEEHSVLERKLLRENYLIL